MNVTESIVSNGHGPLSPSYVVIHETANPGATAANHRDYWARDDTYAVHYVADWDECIHCVPEDRLCWQVGNGNDYVVGIELCHATNQADFEAVWRIGAEWAAWQLSKRGWGVDRLLSHYDCTQRWGGSDHTDPLGYFEEFGRSWAEFVQAVQAKMNGEDDDMTLDELLNAEIAVEGGKVRFEEALSWAYTYAKNGPRDLLDREVAVDGGTNVPVRELISWGYTYSKLANEKVDKLERKVAALEKAVKAKR